MKTNLFPGLEGVDNTQRRAVGLAIPVQLVKNFEKSLETFSLVV